MGAVVIGMDPHKRSATIEVMDRDEMILGGGRYATDVAGYAAMVKFGKQFPERTWAIEGCNGIGKHIANRLLADGELVVDVPPKLSARTRVFATGQGRKTDATDAHSVALVGTRMSGLRPVVDDEQLAVLRILVDRRRSLGDDHTRMVSQLHRLLLELIPGGAKTSLSAAQAKVLLARVRPRDAAGKTRRRVAAELIADLQQVYDRSKAADKELTALLKETGTTLTQLRGIGPSGAARLLVEVGDITRFPTRAHFASWTGTAPIDASSGDHVRHRLSRGGNRQINRVLHIMAIVQLRNATEGRAYYDRKKAAGKTSMEAIRCVKRRLSDIVYRQLIADAIRPSGTGPGGHVGTTLDSSAADSNPDVDASEKSLPGPASHHVTRATNSRPDRSSARSRRPATAPTRSRGQAHSA
jgi:transposase